VSKTAYDAFATDVAAAIRARREAAKMTLEDLAYNANMTARHLHDIEKARGNPTLRTMHNIASALGIKVSDILTDAERRSKPPRKT